MTEVPALVAGRVVDEDGLPVAGATVLFAAGPVPVPDIAQLTGPDGGFAMAAPGLGTYRVRVDAPGHRPEEREVVVGTSVQAALEIALRRAPC